MDKSQWTYYVANEAENDAWQQNMKMLYFLTKILSNERTETKGSSKRRNGNILKKPITKACYEHYTEALNR